MPSATQSFPFSPAELDYLHTSLSSTPPIRPDLRSATDFRPLNAETGVLPAANGSSHVSFSDGGEAIVGVKIEVEKTAATGISATRLQATERNDGDGDVQMDLDGSDVRRVKQWLPQGIPDWVALTLTLPGSRDDDASLIFLEETLREALIAPLSVTVKMPASTGQKQRVSRALQDELVINGRWHFRLCIDVLLVSPSGGGGGAGSTVGASALPLLSMAIWLALRDTRMPQLKSQEDEDPSFEDDWERATYLYGHGEWRTAETDDNGKVKGTEEGLIMIDELRPPITLLVMVAGDNVVFDPSREELAVADAVVAVSVGVTSTSSGDPDAITVPKATTSGRGDIKLTTVALRTLDTAARDTMAGVPRDDADNLKEKTGERVQGVWAPKLGGVKRAVFGNIVKAVLGAGETGKGVAEDVIEGLESFLVNERGRGG